MSKRLNQMYEVRIEAPILAPGLSVTTRCSEKYLKEVMERTFEIVREFNKDRT